MPKNFYVNKSCCSDQFTPTVIGQWLYQVAFDAGNDVSKRTAQKYRWNLGTRGINGMEVMYTSFANFANATSAFQFLQNISDISTCEHTAMCEVSPYFQNNFLDGQRQEVVIKDNKPWMIRNIAEDARYKEDFLTDIYPHATAGSRFYYPSPNLTTAYREYGYVCQWNVQTLEYSADYAIEVDGNFSWSYCMYYHDPSLCVNTKAPPLPSDNQDGYTLHRTSRNYFSLSPEGVMNVLAEMEGFAQNMTSIEEWLHMVGPTDAQVDALSNAAKDGNDMPDSMACYGGICVS